MRCITRDSEEARHRGVRELTFEADAGAVPPVFDAPLQVAFIRPDDTVAVAEGYHDGGLTY